MSAIARYFLNKDGNVAGYDRVKTPLTSALEDEGAIIQYNDAINEIPKSHKYKDTLVVYTPAIPDNNDVLSFFKNNEFQVLKRSEILGEITKNYFSIGVAGTHGKTTTSTLTAYLLHQAGVPVDAFLGGIATNFNSNYVFSKQSKTVVVEADEYDRSFLTLSPNIAVITSTDADHLDIYGEHNNMLTSFQEYANKLPVDGVLILKKGLEIKHKNVITYSVTEQADYYAFDIKTENGKYIFSLQTPDEVLTNIHIGLAGLHNIENAIASFIVGKQLGIDSHVLVEGIKTFKGIKRRFEYIIENEDVVYIDDYAHHPTELEACIKSVRQLYPNKKITGIFQPHLYSRTNDFADEFAKSLSLLDELILLDIYAAREEPIEGVSSRIILDKVNLGNKKIASREDVVDNLDFKDIDVLLTLGAGDIDTLVPVLKNEIEQVIV